MKSKYFVTLLSLALSLLLILSFAACNKDAEETPEDTTKTDETPTVAATETVAFDETDAATDAATEAPTEAASETTPVQDSEEQPTEALEDPTGEAEVPTQETEESSEDPDAVDPNDPTLNMIQVGFGGDGKTPCYDGRYYMDYEYFFNSLGLYSGSIQEIFDDLEGWGGEGAINNFDEVGYCFSVNVPDDGNLYKFYYNWAYVDLRFNHGVTYSDETYQDNGVWTTPGYAYYSDLKVLDDIPGLDNSKIFVWDTTYGLAPGAYKMIEEPSGELNYTYERLGDLEEYWPGLPMLLEE